MELVINDLHKSFKDKKVLTGASYNFKQGKIYGLLGKNGSGKTTFFNIIYGELKKDEGEIYLIENGEKKQINNDIVGMLFSENFLPEFLTGYEFIKFFMDINDENGDPDLYLDKMSFDEEDKHRLIKDYSHGMKSKISLVTIVAGNQKIVLLDEPLTSIDVIMAAEIKKILRELKEDSILILSTHMLELAKDLCDEIVLINNGKFVSLENLEKDENFEEKIVEALKE